MNVPTSSEESSEYSATHKESGFQISGNTTSQPQSKKTRLGIGLLAAIAMLLLVAIFFAGSFWSVLSYSFNAISNTTESSSVADVKKSSSNNGLGWSSDQMISAGATSNAGSKHSSATSETSTPSFYDSEEAVNTSASTESSDSDNSGWISGAQKLVYTASIELQTTDYTSASSKLKDLLAEHNAVLSSENITVSKSTGRPKAIYTILVPADKYEPFMNSIENVATVMSRQSQADNITKQYSDTQAEIESLELQEKRLLEFEAQATNIDEMLDIENRLKTVRSSLTSERNALAAMDTAVSYSTVTITLSDASSTVSAPETEEDFGTRMVSAFNDGIASFIKGGQNFLVWCARNWTGLVIFAVIVIISVIVIRKNVKKRSQHLQSVDNDYWQTPVPSPSKANASQDALGMEESFQTPVDVQEPSSDKTAK